MKFHGRLYTFHDSIIYILNTVTYREFSVSNHVHFFTAYEFNIKEKKKKKLRMYEQIFETFNRGFRRITISQAQHFQNDCIQVTRKQPITIPLFFYSAFLCAFADILLSNIHATQYVNQKCNDETILSFAFDFSSLFLLQKFNCSSKQRQLDSVVSKISHFSCYVLVAKTFCSDSHFCERK